MADPNLPLCTACATQFDGTPGVNPSNCKICDDPRQFVPPGGQSWTTLANLRKNHKNVFKQDEEDKRIWTIQSEPKIGIGQRCFLLETEHGNILWDMIALLDQETIDFINSRGGLKAIAVSHPHYYTTHAHWSAAFDCPIHLAAEDREWLLQSPRPGAPYAFFDGPRGSTTELLPGVTLIKAGGHFPGSLLLHWSRRLFLADTIVTVPSAYSPHPRPPGHTSYVFQWSIVNMLPLPPWEIAAMWRAVKPFAFDATHGAFAGMDVRGRDVRARMLQSAKTQAAHEGWEGRAGMDIFDETL